MAIKFQYNKTSLQQLEKQLKMRERSLPTIKSKESALRIEVKRTKDEVTKLELQLEQEIQSYENMMALWNEFNPELIAVRDVSLSTKKIAGVVVPVVGRDRIRDRPLQPVQCPCLVYRRYRTVEEVGAYRHRGWSFRV